jgi:hypothetical protein
VALIGRIIVVLFGFLTACVAAATTLAVGFMVLAASDLDLAAEPGTFLGEVIAPTGVQHSAMLWVIGVGAFLVAFYALLPAMLVVAIAEGLRLRSVLLYTIAGGIAGMYCYLTLGFSPRSAGTGHVVGREAEIVIAAGIAAGFVYWALAGRNAGRWRRERTVGQGTVRP